MAQQTTRIVTTADVMGGEPRIDGRRITVLQITDLVEGSKMSAQAVADRYNLDIADVYQALVHYHEHPSEMAELRREREQAVDDALEAGMVSLAALEAREQEDEKPER
jgi:uncharacterized protein (DUF433 family)